MKDTIEIVRKFLNEDLFISESEKIALNTIIRDLNTSKKLLSPRNALVKRLIDEIGGTPEDKKVFERIYDKLDDIIDTLDKIKKQIS